MGRKAKSPGKAASPGGAPLTTPDGRYLIVRDRLWRATNPRLSAAKRAKLVGTLMDARRAVKQALAGDDARALKAARAAVDAAKVALGERGPPWWTDGARDFNRHLVKNSPYAAWYSRRARAKSQPQIGRRLRGKM